MVYDTSPVHLIGLAAGGLILLIGAFVLVARPHSAIHRLFFALALMDGLSTLLFRLARMAQEPRTQAFYEGAYYYYFIAFIALLVAFGLIFPRPLTGSRTRARAALGALAVATIALLALYVLDHDLFWTDDPADPVFRVQVAPLGNVLNIAFVAATALLVARLGGAVLRESSPTHRRQASFVLGGMALAYLPYPTTVVIQTLATMPEVFVVGRVDRLVAYWTFALACVALVGSTVLLLRARGDEGRAERRFVLRSFGAVALITLVALALPAPEIGSALRSLALLAYPLLLGYAIARYEVFDIHRQLQRAAVFSIVVTALTGAFIVAQNLMEEVFAQRVFAGIPSGFVGGSLAAIATTLLSVPVGRASRALSRRIVPDLTPDDLQSRKLEIYEHSLESAWGDDVLAEREVRALKALRESLGLTEEDHGRALARVLARKRTRAGAGRGAEEAAA